MDKFVELTADLVANFVANQHVAQADLPKLIEDTYRALWEAGNPAPKVEPEVQQRRQRKQRDTKPVAETDNEPEASDAEVATGDSYGWDDQGKRVIPEPMFDEEK